MRTAAGTSLGLGLASLGERSSFAQDAATPTDGLTFDFSGSGIELPTDDLSFRWLNSGPGPKGVFLAMMFEAYQQAHPNITVEYDQLPWNEIVQVVPLGIRSSNAHDVFQIPLNVPAAQAVEEGWVAPLDDLIPNFEEWQANFPPGSFINGFTDFGGKTYTFPVSSNKRYGTLLLYNRAYMDEAGLDPSETPFTWDAFRDAARVLTEQGGGNYYGLIFEGNQTGRFAEFVSNLARMAGRSASGDNIDWRTGEYVFTSDEYIAAIELLLAIRDDGSIFPGSLALNAHEARARMPQGMAAMILQGPWNIPTWRADAPDYDFGVASQPVPNEGDPLPLTVSPGGSNALWIYAESPYKEVAADVFHYLGTQEGQSNWGKIVGIADPPTSPEALAAANLDERSMTNSAWP
jgi:multiple sugar transport system substrate-binding protein